MCMFVVKRLVHVIVCRKVFCTCRTVIGGENDILPSKRGLLEHPKHRFGSWCMFVIPKSSISYFRVSYQTIMKPRWKVKYQSDIGTWNRCVCNCGLVGFAPFFLLVTNSARCVYSFALNQWIQILYAGVKIWFRVCRVGTHMYQYVCPVIIFKNLWPVCQCSLLFHNF